MIMGKKKKKMYKLQMEILFLQKCCVTPRALSRKYHNLFLKFLLREDEPPHDIIQLLQSQLSMEYSHIIWVRPHHPLQSPIQLQQNIPKNLKKQKGRQKALSEQMYCFTAQLKARKSTNEEEKIMSTVYVS